MFLPLPSLPGFVRGTVPEIPDAFSLTGAEVPYTPRTWSTRLAIDREMRRIQRTERAKLKAKRE